MYTMKLVSTLDCMPGMRLSKPIYTARGQTLVNRNTELTESMIRRLRQMGYEYLYIDDPNTEDIYIEDEVSMATRMALRLSLERLIDQIARQPFGSGRLSISHICWDSVTMVINDLKYPKDDTIMFINVNPPTVDQPLGHFIQNAINVCVYATKIGITEGLTGKDLIAFSLGGLLHDIGNLRLSPDILLKPGSLTQDEFEHVKRHSEIGYELLRNEPGIPAATAQSVLMHHEHIDGSGYPYGLKGNDIHPFARWIGLIAAYDAMTNPRPYRKALLPHEAMEILYAKAGTLYDYDKVDLLRRKLAIFPVGIQVRLSTGQLGIVSKINPSYIHRPVVRILTDEAGNPLKHPEDVDLSKQLNVVISEVGDTKVSEIPGEHAGVR